MLPTIPEEKHRHAGNQQPTTRSQQSKKQTYSSQAFFLTLLCVSAIAAAALVRDKSGSTILQGGNLQRRQQWLLSKGDLPTDCHLVHDDNVKDKCAFVRAHCPDEQAGLISYLEVYFCGMRNAKPLALTLITLWLGTLFSTIGAAASDFFCPNLQSIAALLKMSESLAGVTLLALGNGSPDVFSTFAAMSTNSGSLAVGELIGAAGFITAVVAGTLAVVQPFNVNRVILREIGFFVVAASFSLVFLQDGKLHLWECAVMVGFYICYALVVVLCEWFDKKPGENARNQKVPQNNHTNNGFNDARKRNRDIEESANGPSGQGLDQFDQDSVQQDPQPTITVMVERAYQEGLKVRPAKIHRSMSNVHIRESWFTVAKNTADESARRAKSAHAYEALDQSPHGQTSNAIPLQRNSRHLATTSAERRQDHTDQNLLSPNIRTQGRERAVSMNAMAGTEPDYNFLGGGRFPSKQRDALQPELENQQPLVHSQAQKLLSPNSPASTGANVLSVTDQQQANVNVPSPSPDISTLPLETSSDDAYLAPSTWSKPLRWWPYKVLPDPDDLMGTLFPLVSNFRNIDYWAIPTGLATMITVLLLSVTLPVVQPPPEKIESIEVEVETNDSNEAATTSNTTRGRQPAEDIQSPGQISPSHERYRDDPSVQPSSNNILVNIEAEDPVETSTAPQIQRNASTLATSLNRQVRDSSRPTNQSLAVPIERYRDNPSDSPANDTAPGHEVVNIAITTSHDVPTSSNPSSSTPISKSAEELPAEVDDDLGDWKRWLVIVQTFATPFFVVLLLWANSANPQPRSLLKGTLVSLLVSLVALLAVLATSTPDHPPKWRKGLAFVGFIVAIGWISTIANEVVGVLKFLGVVLDISDAILGLTVFAVGNSIGDLASNIRMARKEKAFTALSACFAGPMLNILLGIGVSGGWITFKGARHHQKKHPGSDLKFKPYALEISTTLLISGATLLLTLLVILIMLPIRKFHMDRKFGYGLIGLWCFTTFMNVIAEVMGWHKEIR